ncbi:MAG: hypothetical protein OXH79_20355 [Boseongicola sp.]|nr:hypothetical protein [Boseongicola sp.]
MQESTLFACLALGKDGIGAGDWPTMPVPVEIRVPVWNRVGAAGPVFERTLSDPRKAETGMTADGSRQRRAGHLLQAVLRSEIG